MKVAEIRGALPLMKDMSLALNLSDNHVQKCGVTVPKAGATAEAFCHETCSITTLGYIKT
jgi:hypothetical protein